MSKPVDRDSLREREIAERFRALWALLRPAKDPSQNQFRSLMRDQIRDALDRGTGEISDSQELEFIANSFAVEDVIARGQFADILAVRHRDLGTPYALKCLSQKARKDPIGKELLIREASIGLTLCHPSIARTHVLLRLDDGRPAILMERCGPSLMAVAQQGRLSVQDISQAFKCGLLALEHLHAAHRIHGDLSPANLLRAANDPSSWKLCDFGLCRTEGETVPLPDIAWAGTLEFQAPEQCSAKTSDIRSDLYSLGRTLLWMLDHCHQGELEDGTLAQLATDLTKPDPDDRPETAGACLARLNR